METKRLLTAWPVGWGPWYPSVGTHVKQGVRVPGWTHALRGVVDRKIDRDCETLDLNYSGLGAAGAAALVPALQHAQRRLTELNLWG